MSFFGTATANPWMRVLDALEKKVNRTSYETWLKPTRFDHSQGRVLFVRVPNPEFCHIVERYGDLISEAIDDLGLEFQDVEFVTDEPQRGNGKAVRATETRQEPLAPQESPMAAPAQQQRFDWDGAAQLNPKYTFDDFVSGAGNQFAHAAARAVAERPSRPTTRFSCTAASAWERPISCRRSVTRSRSGSLRRRFATCPASVSPTT